MNSFSDGTRRRVTGAGHPNHMPEVGAEEQKEAQRSLPLNTLAQLLDGQIDVVGIDLQSSAGQVARAMTWSLT